MDSLLDAADRYASAHAGPDGLARTAIAGLSVVRALQPSGLQYAISYPLVCLVLQGRKQVTRGADRYAFGAGDSLLIAADVPTVSQITQASRAEPYLSLVLDLDLTVVAELVLEMASRPAAGDAAVRVEPTEQDVAASALRLIRLLERPGALPILQKQAVREMHY